MHWLSWTEKLTALAVITGCGMTGTLAAATTEPSHSVLQDLTPVQIERRFSAEAPKNAEDALELPTSYLYEPVPDAVLEQLGPHLVEYDAFLVTYLSQADAELLIETARAHGLVAHSVLPRDIVLSWHSFDPLEPTERIPRHLADLAQAIPRLFLAQFAYPLQTSWLQELSNCGVEKLAYFQHRTFLFRADSLDIIENCSPSRHIYWLDSFRSSDRVKPLIMERGAADLYTLQYVHGTNLAGARDALPEDVEPVDTYSSEQDKVAYIRVIADDEQLRAILLKSPDLLSISPAGSPAVSDERQGMIVAGIHNGVRIRWPGEASFAHYRDWLTTRGLLSLSTPQVVAVFDAGYDDGSPPSSAVDHHPDLENPERLDGINSYGISSTRDRIGHGTMVSGVIAGDGFTGTGATDSEGLYYGTGVAPGVKVFAARLRSLDPESSTTPGIFDFGDHEAALAEARNHAHGGDRALIANESWNAHLSLTPYSPINSYEERARFFDARVFDANVQLAGWQSMTIVFSAGNFADTCNQATWDTVASPATAKNVISVGSTDSYRPAPSPSLQCRPCDQGFDGRPKNDDATHIANLADFSSRGRYFGPNDLKKPHTTRIKPDLVAPGNRVFSTVPYESPSYPNGFVGCTDFYPDPPDGLYYTYGSGTSFAAPVVAGVAALGRHWFSVRGTTPSPSLLKAALIATADDLGGKANNGTDHRPSPRYGWGRVSLERLTDDVSKWYRTDNSSLAVETGEVRTWTRTIQNGARDTYVVLVWTDEPTMVNGNSQAALVNDLSLKVDGGTWRGNHFNEIFGVDDGYSYRYSVGVGGQDAVNTVEAVFIPAGVFSSGQSITFTITGENVPEPLGTWGQRFALYAYNVQ